MQCKKKTCCVFRSLKSSIVFQISEVSTLQITEQVSISSAMYLASLLVYVDGLINL